MTTSRRITFNCKQCGKSVSRYASAAVHDNPAFCSRACYYVWAKETGYFHRRTTKQCETCGKEFTRVASAVDARFCSQACMLVWRGPVVSEKRYQPETHLTRECEWCGKSFEIPQSWVRKNWGRFCSRACNGASSARTSQRSVSKVETQFAEMLAAAGLSFERHVRIGSFVVDIYFAEKRLIVEFDGEYWHSLPRVVEKDARKDAYAAKHDYRILHIPERLYYDEPKATLQMVLGALT